MNAKSKKDKRIYIYADSDKDKDKAKTKANIQVFPNLILISNQKEVKGLMSILINIKNEI